MTQATCTLPKINRQWLLRRRPQGASTPDDFEYRELVPPRTDDLAPGELVLLNRVFLCAPTMRNWMGPPTNALYPCMPLGEPVMAPAGCVVVASARPGIAVGQQVTSFTHWQDYDRVGPGHVVTPFTDGADLIEEMGVLGLNARTAYFGMLRVGQPKAGETVVVSGAAGSTGSIAVQIAKLQGCRVIGIAGGPVKCERLVRELGLDGAIDYRLGEVEPQMRALCPQGVDVFYDNVGGDVLQAAVEVMAKHGRIVLCGQIAGYNDDRPVPGPNNMMRLVYCSITLRGFLLSDYAGEIPAAVEQLRRWFAEGKLKARVDARPGFHRIPQTFSALFDGSNDGTLLALAD